jgi:hypothetical protein
MLPGYRSATSWVHYTTSCNTQSSAPEDGRNHRPKYVQLIGIINKPLLLHLVGCLYYVETRVFKQKLYVYRGSRKQLQQASHVFLLILYLRVCQLPVIQGSLTSS